MNKLNHVDFIMDGNGRWGEKKKNNMNFGHVKGVDVVKKIVSSSLNLKIPILTFYVFSTENWKRPRKEINFLFYNSAKSPDYSEYLVYFKHFANPDFVTGREHGLMYYYLQYFNFFQQ